MMGDEEFSFKPMSEAEQAEFQARRQRSEKITKLMSEYLLRGFQMLDSYCPDCTNILMRDKKGVTFCIACEEVDNKPLVVEDKIRQGGDTEKNGHCVQAAGSRTPERCVSPKPTGKNVNASCELLPETRFVIEAQLRRSLKRVLDESNPKLCADYVNLVKSCVETLIVVDRAEASCSHN